MPKEQAHPIEIGDFVYHPKYEDMGKVIDAWIFPDGQKRAAVFCLVEYAKHVPDPTSEFIFKKNPKAAWVPLSQLRVIE